MSEVRQNATAVVTGGNAGLGLGTVRTLAASGRLSDIVMASRDPIRGQRAADSVAAGGTRIHVAELDLASLASVRSFPAALTTLGIPPLSALICNAGVQVVDGTRTTVDGFEETFAVNVLGHFLLVNLLLGFLRPRARVILVSSGTHDPQLRTGMPAPQYTSAAELAAGRGLDAGGNKLGRLRYTTSKLCDVYLAYELAKRFPPDATDGPALVASAMDPGLMAGSGLARDYGPVSRFAWRYVLPPLARFMKGAMTTETSGADLSHLATEEAFGTESGLYFVGTTPTPSSVLSYNQFNAVDLWTTCASLSGIDP